MCKLCDDDAKYGHLGGEMSETLKPSINELRNTFSYNENSGVLIWKIQPGNVVKAGSIIGCPDGKGRLRFQWKCKRYPVHVVCFAIYHGHWPKNQVDHKNRNKIDNRISNLREATNQQNSFNRVGHSSSGLKGVSFHKNDKTYHARISINGKCKYLGRFKIASDAAIAYNNAAKELHGEFALLNNI